MALMVVSFPDGHGGWINMLEKLYVCTTIPFVLGRPLVENAPLRRFGDSANGVQRFGDRSSPFVPPARKPPGQSVKVPVWAILDALLKPGARTVIPCTTGTLFISSSGALKVRCAEVGTDICEEDEIHPSVYRFIAIDGQSKEIIMMNDGPFPVLIAAGSLVAHARLIDDDKTPSFAAVEFDAREAAAGPFGVGSISRREVLHALSAAIGSRLANHPAEEANMRLDELSANVMQRTEGETRPVQDIRRRFVTDVEPCADRSGQFGLSIAPRPHSKRQGTRTCVCSAPLSGAVGDSHQVTGEGSGAPS